MDIKEKLMSFIDKQKISLKTPTSPVLGAEFVTSDEFEGRTAVTAQPQRRAGLLNHHILTPEAEQAVIDSIEALYFESGDVDVGEHELLKFPDSADVHVINGMRSRLRKQQTIVSRRVSDLIMQKQGLCSKEMERVTELQREVIKGVGLCVEGRKKLAQGRSQFTSASLGILANYSKRQKIACVIRSLRMIRTLQMTDVQLQSLLKVEDYPGAIQLLLECQKAAATFKHFTCISELSTKLQDTLEGAEEQLDVALAKVAANFNAANYEKLQIAYGLLGKTQTLMDQLHMHLTSHIHNSAFTIILGYVELYNSAGSCNAGSGSSFSKLQYSELCKYVNEESFLPCLLDLSKCMWNVLKSYRSIIKWHENDGKVAEEDVSCKAEKDVEAATSRKYAKQKLEHGLYRIWQDVQAKVRTFILASDLSHFKFDDFLRILDVINKLIDVGECFCGSKSETLNESIKKQSINYFRNHHRVRMEELHMFLENEGWEACPVKSTFSIYQLMEYRFLKGKDASFTQISTPTSSPSKKPGIITEKKDVFDLFSRESSPFDIAAEETIEEDIMANGETGDPLNLSDDDSDEDVPDELKRDFVDEQTGDAPQHHLKRKLDHGKTPIVTNTTLTILRLIGKYIQMMRLLQPIAFDVMVCLSHLFDYYLYSVFTFFGARGELDQNPSRRLRGSLKRIQDTLILNPEASQDDPSDKDKQFLMKLECLTAVRPLPDRHLVETYIKAYYLPEGALEEWVQQNRGDYSPRQLTALVATMTHISKRTRQKIATLIEEAGKRTQ
nr:syndetin-like [Cherax quadricarinatus]